MKILIALYKYFSWGGLQKDALRLAQEAMERGHEVAVFTTDWPEPPQGLLVERVSVKGMTNVARMENFSRAWLERLKKGGFDVTLAMNRVPGADFYFAADACMARYYDGKWPKWWLKLNPRYRHILDAEQRVMGKESQTIVMTIAAAQRKDMQECYDLPDRRIIELPPGFNDECRCPDESRAAIARAEVRRMLEVEDEEFMLVSVASNARLKGIDRTIAAIAALPLELQKKVKWFGIGRLDERLVRKMAAKCGILPQCRLLGAREDLPKLLLAADLMIHPARSEGAGSVLMEALVAGLPVICTEICGFSPYVAEAESPVLPEPFSQQRLDEVLENTLAHIDGVAAAVRAKASKWPPAARRQKTIMDALERFVRESSDVSVSVIVPCYQAASTVERCLDSLAAQTHRPYEVIVVNDASPDETSAVLQRYRERTGLNMKVIEFPENKGVSAARNAGLAAAAGQFVMFLDADDWLKDDCLARMARAQVASDASLVACNSCLVTEHGTERGHVFRSGEKSGVAVIDNPVREPMCFTVLQGFFGSSCMKIYRRKELEEKHLQFDETLKFAEDSLFATLAALNAERLAVLTDYDGYCYFQHECSCVHTIDVGKRLDSLQRMIETLEKAVPKEARMILLQKCLEFVWTVRRFGGVRRNFWMKSCIEMPVFKSVVLPVVLAYGKTKHRLLIRALAHGFLSAVVFW